MKVTLQDSSGFPMCLSQEKEMTLGDFQGVVRLLFLVGKSFACEWHLAGFSHEAQVGLPCVWMERLRGSR